MYKELFTQDELKEIIEQYRMEIAEIKSFGDNYSFLPIFVNKKDYQYFRIQVTFNENFLQVVIMPYMKLEKKVIYRKYDELDEIEKQKKENLMVKIFYDKYLHTISSFAETIKEKILDNCKKYKQFKLRTLFKNKLNIKIIIYWFHKNEEVIMGNEIF